MLMMIITSALEGASDYPSELEIEITGDESDGICRQYTHIKSQTIHTYQVTALLGTLFKPNRKVAQVDHYSTQSIICNAFMFRLTQMLYQ